MTFDASKPSIARVYDVMLGGKDNFAADREVAAMLVAAYPLFANWAKDNRVFLGRAVSYAASRGVGQFIDVGSGLPTSPNTDEIARREVPGARVVYVDNDPMVISLIRALLTSDDGIAAVEGDLRDPEAILATPEQIRGFFGDLDLISPGLVDAGRWRPGWAPPQQPRRKAMMLAGVAHKRT